MEVSERQELERIIDSHDDGFTVNCLVQIQRDCKIPYQDMQQVRLVHTLVVQYKGLIDIAGNAAQVVEEQMKSKEKEEAKAQMKNENATLNHYMLKPPELKGVELFEHMIKYRGTHVGRSKPSPYLGIYVSDLQQGLIQPTEEELTQGRIMRESVGMGAKLKLVKRKLDNLGYIKSHSGLQNNEARLERLKSEMEMAASLAENNGTRDQEKVENWRLGTRNIEKLQRHRMKS